MYNPVIGLEIHTELKTRTKMFCGCLNNPNERHPNKNICPICAGHPGTLPVINKEAVKKVIKTGFALNSEILEFSKFDRKNYFYPDLPKGYQISQYDKPLCLGGFLNIKTSDGDKKINITRIHLEEDTGRLIHKGKDSLIDLNRAGVPLMELVTEPDIKTAEEAKKFCEELRLILRYLDVSNADMEKGEMRCEANISLRQVNGEFGTKVEVKNLNSFKAVERAIKYEIERQSKILDAGEKIIQETRGWDENKEITFSQRLKEEAHDYRYFPEPDLPPLKINKIEENGEIIFNTEKIKIEIPELPRQKRNRFKEEFGLPENDIEIFVLNPAFADYFENIVSEIDEWLKSERKEPKTSDNRVKVIKLAANYLLTDLQKIMNETSAEVKDLMIAAEDFAELIILIYENKISSKTAKEVLKEMFGTGADPSHIIEEKGLTQESNEEEIKKTVIEIINNNPNSVSDYREGKTNALQFLIGQAMAFTKGKANPQTLNKIFIEQLTK